MIKAVIFDIDNTLTDFMKMKRAAVDSAVESMIDAGLKVEKTAMVEKIFEIYWKDGVEDQRIFDKVRECALGAQRNAEPFCMCLGRSDPILSHCYRGFEFSDRLSSLAAPPFDAEPRLKLFACICSKAFFFNSFSSCFFVFGA